MEWLGALALFLASVLPGCAQSVSTFQFGHASGASIERLGLGHIGGVERVASTWFEASWRFHGERGWRAHYNGPALGVGVFRAGLRGDLDYGRPVGAYGFFQWPVIDTDRFDLRLQAALGFAVGWRPFDPVTNPDQRAIGTPVTALVRFSPTIGVRLSEAWGLSVGLQGSHYSNGALAQPNGGVTALAPALAVEWTPAGPRIPPGFPSEPMSGDGGARPTRSAPPVHAGGWAGRARIFGGVKSLRVETPARIETRRVAVRGATFSLHRTLGPRFRALLATDVLLDGSGGRRHTVTWPAGIDALSARDQLSVGAALGLELIVGQVSVEAAYGNVFWRRALPGQVGHRYQKLGLTWQATERLQGSVMVRSGDGVADFLEWGIAVVR